MKQPSPATGLGSPDVSSQGVATQGVTSHGVTSQGLRKAWSWAELGVHLLVALLAAIALLNDGVHWQLFIFLATYALAAAETIWNRGATIAPRGNVLHTLLFAAMLITWGAALVVSPTAAFIAFGLYLLCSMRLPFMWACASVLIIAIAAMWRLSLDSGWTVGGVVGPIIGAVVAISLGWGMRTLIEQASARERASHTAGEIAERSRLAGDIHDTVAQGLSSIAMLMHSAEAQLLQGMPPGPQRDALLDTLRLTRNTATENLQETRAIIAALQPAPLQHSDLHIALGRILQHVPPTLTADLAIHHETTGATPTLDPTIESTILRITQSLVSNIVKHAQADTARVTLTYFPHQVVLDVVDNGRGMDTNTTTYSPVGLAGVARRAAQCNGSMEIESSPGHGCGVSVKLPTHSTTKP